MDINNLVSFEDTSVAFSSKSDKDLRKMYWLFASMNNNVLVNLGTSLLKSAFKLNFPIKKAIKNTLFQHFCGGETIEECESTIQKLGAYHIGAILDYSVEGEGTDSSYDATVEEILQIIKKAKNNPLIPFAVFKVSGIAPMTLLQKKQEGKFFAEHEEQAFSRFLNRMERICQAAFNSDVRLFVDAEETWYQDVVDGLVYQMMEKYNREKPIVFNTYQMYRKDMLGNLIRAYGEAEEKGYYLGVKLVRGAYLEKEKERALKLGYPDPMQASKEDTDNDFNQAVYFCVDNRHRVAMCLGSHNEYSNFYLVLLMEKHQIKRDDPRFWFSQLYGMSDNISYNLAKEGYNVVKYVPYGPVETAMPYLFRRAEENTAIAGQTSRELMLISKEMERRKMEVPRENTDKEEPFLQENHK